MPVKLQGKELSEYNSVHAWVKRHYGKASKCELCPNPNGYRYEWANLSGEYKRDRADWMELCQSCHKMKDQGDSCKHGHKYSEIRRSTGHRKCDVCIDIANKKYLAKRDKLKNK